MTTRTISSKVLRRLQKRGQRSHKGENGCVLILAGSRSFHGPLFFSGIAASRIVDLVFVATSSENRAYAKRLSPEFIVTGLDKKTILPFLQKADSILIGPGMEPNPKNKKLVQWILQKFPNKKMVLDAAAFQLLSPKNLHRNCCVTPHATEFKRFFGVFASPENAQKMARKFGCLVVLKSHYRMVTDGKTVWKNKNGNAGLSTGGTGDILAGLIAGFAAKNPLESAAQAALFLAGASADALYQKQGFLFNATDVLERIPLVFGRTVP